MCPVANRERVKKEKEKPKTTRLTVKCNYNVAEALVRGGPMGSFALLLVAMSRRDRCIADLFSLCK